MKKKLLLLISLLLFGVQLAIADDKVTTNEIVLGSAISLTGKYTTNGRHTKNGYDLAVNLINAKGGISVAGKNYKLRIIYYDDESTPAKAAQLAKRLITKDKVKFLLGPYSSGLTKAIAPVTEKYKIPMIEANGASRSLFTKGYKYLFAMLTTADQYLTPAVDLVVSNAKAKGKKISDIKLALVFADDTFSQDVKLGALASAKKYGIKIIIDENLPNDLVKMTAILNKVRALKPDLLLISGYAKGAITASLQLEQLKIDVPAVAMTHCDSAAIERKTPKGAEYTLCARQWQKQLTYQDDDGLFGNGFDFVRIFRKEYGYEPPYQSAESAAAVQVWADAFQRANSLDTERLRSAIAKTNMQTFYGNVRFDKAGRNIAKPMVMSQIINSDYVVVAPEKWAKTKFIYPKPKWSER